MNDKEILVILQDLFKKVFGEGAKITSSTTTKDIQEWDSLNNLILLTEIQQKFQINFSLSEILGLENVGDMVRLIEQRIKENE